MQPRERVVSAIALLAFTLIFLALTVTSYVRKSATWDEPQQLVAGYAALKLGNYRLDPEHPPLLRMWAALPLLASADVRLDPADPAWEQADAYELGHAFLYRDNDGDKLLYRARFMIVLLGLGLGLLVFVWARELFGVWPAVGTLALYAFEPNVLAHASLVTTDLGVTCLLFAAVYSLWRTARRFSAPNLLALAAATGLAVVSKYSALILGPISIALLLTRMGSKDPWPGGRPRSRVGRVAAILLAQSLAAYLATWAVHGLRYAPAPGEAGRRLFVTSSAEWVRERTPILSSLVDTIDRHHLLPNAASQGFLFGRVRSLERPAYLAGSYAREGFWSYFPTAFLVKTPLAVLLLAAGGMIVLARRGLPVRRALPYLLLTPVLFTAAAIASPLNIGLRHLLPVTPFVLLACGAALAGLGERRRWIAIVAVALAAVETLSVHPDYLAFFNRLSGGPGRGHEVLVDANLDWGQDLKGLSRWLQANRVDHVNLSYFGTADPAYYGIHCTHLPGAPFFARDQVGEPRLPGWVAISATNLHGVYLDPSVRDLYRPLLEQTPVVVIGHSIHVFWVERPWW